ncbi:MAG: Crp/Fnr family transcriptional regulator [Anaerolineae bacterium]|nr:Crp/Fnr family transcriptional regulator [Anaerolineae bacterium]
MDTAAELFRLAPEFAGLSDATLARLAQVLLPLHCSAGQIVQLEGEACRGMCWVARGEVTVFRTAADGRELVMARLHRGGAFNIVPPFEDPPMCRASVRAAAETTLWRLPLEAIPPLLAACPDFSAALLRRFAAQLGHLNRLVEQIALHSVRGRLARFLLDLADGVTPAREYTQDEIAAHIGTVRDMVGRILRSFEDAGLIRRDRSRILLRNRAGLEAEARE